MLDKPSLKRNKAARKAGIDVVTLLMKGVTIHFEGQLVSTHLKAMQRISIINQRLPNNVNSY